MGHKPQHALQADRPESGGADRDDMKEKSGIQELDREKLARSAQEAKQASGAAETEGKTGLQNGVESPRNSQ